MRKAAGKPAFTAHQYNLCADFVTCACGRQHKRIPRSPSGSPLDDKLYNLGLKFAHNFDFNDPVAATKTLAKIERRAAEVLADL